MDNVIEIQSRISSMGRPPKYATDAERKAAHVQATLRHRERNRDNWNKYRRAYGKANPEKIKEWNQKRYYKNHTETLEYHREYRRQLKADVIAAYGGCCTCCGESAVEFLTIDHSRGWAKSKEFYGNAPRASHRLYMWLRDRDYPQDGFRVLCCNCNFAFGRYGYCPHTKAQIAASCGRR